MVWILAGGGARLLHAGDHGLARLLLDLADAIFELEAVGGDVARGERRRDGAQLADERGPSLLVNGAARLAVVLRQSLHRPA